VRTNLPPRTIMRGPGTMQAVLLVEHIVDRIAAHLGADPVLVRERNLLTKPRAEGARPRGCPLRTPPAPPQTLVRARAARRTRAARAMAVRCAEELWLVAARPGVRAPACAVGVCAAAAQTVGARGCIGRALDRLTVTLPVARRPALCTCNAPMPVRGSRTPAVRRYAGLPARDQREHNAPRVP
jgi:hypothetical protein